MGGPSSARRNPVLGRVGRGAVRPNEALRRLLRLLRGSRHPSGSGRRQQCRRGPLRPSVPSSRISSSTGQVARRGAQRLCDVCAGTRPHEAERREHSRDRSQLVRSVRRRTNSGQHALLATRDCPLTRLKPQIDRLVGLQQPVSFVEIFLAEGSPRVSADNRPGLISQRWDEIIRQPLIPFDPAARQRRLAHAFESLAPFIHTHEAMKRAGVLD